jgi:hypothetical protein
MLIPITSEDGSAASWAMIEMQGELERKDGGSLDEAFDVGTLSTSSTVSGKACNTAYSRACTDLGVAMLCGMRLSQLPSAPFDGLESAWLPSLRTGSRAADHWLSPAGGQAVGAEETICGDGPGTGCRRRKHTLQGGRSASAESKGTNLGRDIACRLSAEAASWHACQRRGMAHMPPASSAGACSNLALQVIGVIREKILFKARPRPLITKPGIK